MRRLGTNSAVYITLAFSALALGVFGPYAFGQAGAQQKKPAATPELGISPRTLRFAAQKTGARSVPQSVILTNHTKQDLIVQRVTASEGFRLEAPGFPQKVLAGGSTAAVVTFNPQQEGVASGVLTILSNPGGKVWMVPLSGKATRFWGCPDRICADLLLAIGLCLFYWLAMVVVRWHRVARPTRELLRAQIAALQAELATLPEKPPADPNGTRLQKLQELLQKASDLIDTSKTSTADFLFWSRGQEITGWGFVHEVEVQMIPLLLEPTVKTRLELAEQRLREINSTTAVALADLIGQELKSSAADSERRRALLEQGLYTIYDCKDTGYASLVSWQNKTSWLVGCGLVLIMVLTGVIPDHGILFLLGGAGGLLSRMSRSLNRKDVPTDYGASWTFLFLSPVAGAVGAWAGILLSNLLIEAQILGGVFQVDWHQPTTPKILGIALLFGFSERLLDGILDKLVGTVITDQQTTTPPNTRSFTPAPAPAGLKITSPLVLPDGQVDKEYSGKVEVSGNTGSPKWSLVPPADLPQGLKLGENDGTITGKPQKDGTFKFTVKVKDQTAEVSQEFTITIKPPAM